MRSSEEIRKRFQDPEFQKKYQEQRQHYQKYQRSQRMDVAERLLGLLAHLGVEDAEVKSDFDGERWIEFTWAGDRDSMAKQLDFQVEWEPYWDLAWTNLVNDVPTDKYRIIISKPQKKAYAGKVYKMAELLIDESDWETTQHVEVGEPTYDEPDEDEDQIDGYTDVEVVFAGNKKLTVRVHWFVKYDFKRWRGKPYAETRDSGISRIEIKSPDAAEVFFTEDKDPSTKEPANNHLSELQEDIEMAEADGKIDVIPRELLLDWESSFNVEDYR